MTLEHRLDHGPRRLHAVFAGEEHAVSGQRVAQQPLVRRLLARVLIAEVQLVLMAYESLARFFDTGCECDLRLGCEAKADVVGSSGWLMRVGEQTLGRGLELDPGLGHRLGEALSSAEIPGHAGPAPGFD